MTYKCLFTVSIFRPYPSWLVDETGIDPFKLLELRSSQSIRESAPSDDGIDPERLLLFSALHYQIYQKSDQTKLPQAVQSRDLRDRKY